MKLVAGVAVGYVLGSRAGRERYEQIAATARRVAAHPTAVQAQEKAKTLLGTGAEAVNAKFDVGALEEAPTTTTDSAANPSPARRKPRKPGPRGTTASPTARDSSL
ncbi:hypothetical protein AB0F72_19325 [Actinoplanes sp. NPDC023936]|uniref:hypothetical protein n=1 Tax=Actinoplanes sp. NPDC023936 TaxID=3154910 RepID=UPI0033D97C6B